MREKISGELVFCWGPRRGVPIHNGRTEIRQRTRLDEIRHRFCDLLLFQ